MLAPNWRSSTTVALAILRAPVMQWRDLGINQCELVSFTTPRAIGTAAD